MIELNDKEPQEGTINNRNREKFVKLTCQKRIQLIATLFQNKDNKMFQALGK